ncbi:FAD/NAD(P)-binding oxidoreductase, partial [Streptomyces niveus]
LGPCQARICGPTVAELRRGTDNGSGPGPHHRPVAEPIRLGELARPPEARPASPNSPAEESTS